MDLSPEQIRWILLYIFILLISIAFHEFGHAYMADRLGDDTPRRQGRVTLNPLAHADPIGTLLLPLFGSLAVAAGSGVGGFGWGKPVQWQPHRIRRGISMSLANILVSFAGPAMNLLLALVIAVIRTVLLWQSVIPMYGGVDELLMFTIGANFVLFFFNLMPVPPLDGGHIAGAFMPYRYRDQWDSVTRFAPFLLLAILMIPKLRLVFVVPATWCRDQLNAGLFALFGLA